MMSKNGFSRCGEIYIGRLRKEGRYSTAHVYKNALLSFSLFCGTFNVSFRQVTRERLRRYGQYLYECAQHRFHVYAYASQYLQPGSGSG